MADVFISYSHKDFEYAHRLADELKRRNIDVWIDDRIDYGDRWPQTIQQNLSACRTFIVVMSTNAFNSMWVQNEVSYAQANQKMIFPLLLEGQVWLSMSAMQFVDVRGDTLPPDRFFEKVEASLQGTQRPPQPAPVNKQQAHPARKQPPVHKSRSGLFLGGAFVLLAIVVAIMIFRPPSDGNPEATERPTDPVAQTEAATDAPATEESTDEPPGTESPTEPPSAEVPVGSVLSTQGRLTYLRIHDVGTGYGGESDFLDAEVVIQLDSEPEKAFGIQLRNPLEETSHREMLDILRDAFNRGDVVVIDYVKTGENTGIIIRVLSLP